MKIASYMQKSKLSILLFGTQIATGGAQKVLLDQADWFHQHGYQVVVAFFYDRDNLYEQWQKRVNFPIYVLTAYRKQLTVWKSAIEMGKGLANLWRLLRKEKFDVIESFTHDSNLLALPLAWLARVPVRLATHHGLADTFSGGRILLHAWLVNLKIASALVVVSTRTQQSALDEGVSPQNLVLIKNGVEPVAIEDVDQAKARQAAGLNPTDDLIISVGRLVSEKAHEVLISAVPLILKEYPSAKVGILGDGVLRPQLQAQIESLKLTETVRLFGTQENVSEYLAIAKIFVLPSRSEGLPIALLEAMSAGLPVIVTNLDGMSDVVEHGGNGLLTPVEDSAALAEAILQLLRDPVYARQLGARGKKQIVENYSKDNMAKEYLALMKKRLKLVEEK